MMVEHNQSANVPSGMGYDNKYKFNGKELDDATGRTKHTTSNSRSCGWDGWSICWSKNIWYSRFVVIWTSRRFRRRNCGSYHWWVLRRPIRRIYYRRLLSVNI